jgi:hypothetical protein
MILRMLADSADPSYSLPPLSNKFAAEAAVFASDLDNVKPVAGATLGKTPQEGFFGRAAGLSSFQRFGTRVWVHRFGHRTKLSSRAIPGRFLGFEHPFGAGISRVLLDKGCATQSQTVKFSNGWAHLLPAFGTSAGGRGGNGDHMSQVGPLQDTDDEEDESEGSYAVNTNPAHAYIPDAVALLEPEPEPELEKAQTQGPAAASLQNANQPKRSIHNPHPIDMVHSAKLWPAQPAPEHSGQSRGERSGEYNGTQMRRRSTRWQKRRPKQWHFAAVHVADVPQIAREIFDCTDSSEWHKVENTKVSACLLLHT